MWRIPCIGDRVYRETTDEVKQFGETTGVHILNPHVLVIVRWEASDCETTHLLSRNRIHPAEPRNDRP